MRCSLPVAPWDLVEEHDLARHLEVGEPRGGEARWISCSSTLRALAQHHGRRRPPRRAWRAAWRRSTTCATAGWSISTSSTSSGPTFSPPRLMISFSRPVSAGSRPRRACPGRRCGTSRRVKRLGVGLRVVLVAGRTLGPRMTTSPISPGSRMAAVLADDARPRARRRARPSPACARRAAAGSRPSGARPRSCRSSRSRARRRSPPAPHAPAAAARPRTSG